LAIYKSSHQQSYDTSSPVSTWIGDNLRQVYHPAVIQATQANSAWPSHRG